MNKIKSIIFLLVIFLCTSCGANLDYNMDIDTSKETISMDIYMKITESDYEKIQGGKDKLIEIINTKKPNDFTFSMDDNDANKYVFSLEFKSFQDYQERYKKISGIESTSVFERSGYSRKKPFKENKNIEIKDDMSLLMNWLKDALTSSGVIAEKDKDNIISSQNFNYTFNGQSSLDYEDNHYNEESVINIENTKVNAMLKKDNKLDFGLSFIIDKNNAKDFTENYIKYIKTKKVSKQGYKETTHKNKTFIEYFIEINDINLENEKGSKKINSVFGEDFAFVSYYNVEEGNIIKSVNRQNTSINLNFYKLFELDILNPTTVKVDLDGVKIDSENSSTDLKVPYVTKKLMNGQFDIVLNTYSEQYNIFFILIIILLIIALIILIIRYGPRKFIEFIKEICYKSTNKMRVIIRQYCFIHQYEIKNNIIECDKFHIKITNIAKIDCGKTINQNSIISSMLLWGICILLFQILPIFILLCMLLVATIWTIKTVIEYHIISINIELISGKNYYFSSENNEKTKEMYMVLLEKINQDKDSNINLKEIFNLIEKGEGK